MTNEEFQSIVLSELKSIKTDISDLKTDVSGLKTDVSGLKIDVNDLKTDVSSLTEGQKRLESNVKDLKDGQLRLETNQKEIERVSKSIHEQTANLMEFRWTTTQKLDEMNKTIRRTEIATADNWSDIAKLKSII